MRTSSVRGTPHLALYSSTGLFQLLSALLVLAFLEYSSALFCILGSFLDLYARPMRSRCLVPIRIRSIATTISGRPRELLEVLSIDTPLNSDVRPNRVYSVYFGILLFSSTGDTTPDPIRDTLLSFKIHFYKFLFSNFYFSNHPTSNDDCSTSRNLYNVKCVPLHFKVQ